MLANTEDRQGRVSSRGLLLPRPVNARHGRYIQGPCTGSATCISRKHASRASTEKPLGSSSQTPVLSELATTDTMIARLYMVTWHICTLSN
jgi:hypothetical protein